MSDAHSWAADQEQEAEYRQQAETKRQMAEIGKLSVGLLTVDEVRLVMTYDIGQQWQRRGLASIYSRLTGKPLPPSAAA